MSLINSECINLWFTVGKWDRGPAGIYSYAVSGHFLHWPSQVGICCFDFFRVSSKGESCHPGAQGPGDNGVHAWDWLSQMPGFLPLYDVHLCHLGGRNDLIESVTLKSHPWARLHHCSHSVMCVCEQSYLTLCDPVDCTPPGPSVLVIS